MVWMIHVSGHAIDQNRRKGKNLPVFMIKTDIDGPARYAHGVDLPGPSYTVYSSKPNKDNIRVWIETHVEPRLIDECDSQGNPI